jgi:hypothetical protein
VKSRLVYLAENDLSGDNLHLRVRYAAVATTPFTVAATKRNGVKLNAPPKPRTGIANTTNPVLITIPAATAGITFHLRLMAPTAAPANASPTAIGKCRIPSGKPLTTAVAKCPKPKTQKPSTGPKYNAAKNPGAESKATDGTGLGK